MDIQNLKAYFTLIHFVAVPIALLLTYFHYLLTLKNEEGSYFVMFYVGVSLIPLANIVLIFDLFAEIHKASIKSKT